VKVGKFEGPLDLLLHLIERRKLHISQVSLAQVADDYVTLLRGEGGRQSMGEMANFILVASTLMLIKSLALLPTLQLTEEESGSLADLEQRLKQLQRVRELSRHLQGRFAEPVAWLPAQLPGRAAPVFSPTAETTPSRLGETIKNILRNLPQPEVLPEKIVRQIISLEEVITQLAGRIEQAFKLSFRDFVQDKKDKINIIVSFLGMLELVKQGAIEIEQRAEFGEITMENRRVGVPRY